MKDYKFQAPAHQLDPQHISSQRVRLYQLLEKEIFDTLEYIDIQHFAPRIKSEVCWVIGMQDTVVPPVTQMATYNNINTKKHLVTLPEYGHEYLPKVSDDMRSYFID